MTFSVAYISSVTNQHDMCLYIKYMIELIFYLRGTLCSVYLYKMYSSTVTSKDLITIVSKDIFPIQITKGLTDE